MFIKTGLSGWALSLVADGVQTCLNWFNFLLTVHTVILLFSEKLTVFRERHCRYLTQFMINNTVKIKDMQKTNKPKWQ